MWAYRINSVYANIEFTRPLNQVERILSSRMTSEFPMDSHLVVQEAWAEAEKLWHTLGWQHDINGDPRVFAVPGHDGLKLGFLVVTQDRRTFIASPTPCDWMKSYLDWDAYTHSDEIDDARKAILSDGTELVVPRRSNVSTTLNWYATKAGNLTTNHENCHITVFRSRHNDGYKAVLSWGETLRTFTPTQPTEEQACEYVASNYERIKRDLTSQALNADDDW